MRCQRNAGDWRRESCNREADFVRCILLAGSTPDNMEYRHEPLCIRHALSAATANKIVRPLDTVEFQPTASVAARL